MDKVQIFNPLRKLKSKKRLEKWTHETKNTNITHNSSLTRKPIMKHKKSELEYCQFNTEKITPILLCIDISAV